MTSRQRQIRQGLAVLGIERLRSFIQAESVQASEVATVEFVKEALDEGEDLEATLLASWNDIFGDGNDYGFELVVISLAENRF